MYLGQLQFGAIINIIYIILLYIFLWKTYISPEEKFIEGIQMYQSMRTFFIVMTLFPTGLRQTADPLLWYSGLPFTSLLHFLPCPQSHSAFWLHLNQGIALSVINLISRSLQLWFLCLEYHSLFNLLKLSWSQLGPPIWSFPCPAKVVQVILI